MSINHIGDSELLTDLLVSGNGYFYKRMQKIPNQAIEKVFRDVAADKKGSKPLVRVVRNTHVVGSKTIRYSICVLRYPDQPSFLRKPLTGWHETKYAFLLIVEVDDNVAVYKRNASNMGELDAYIEPLDYVTISRLFVDGGTQFEKFYVSQLSTAEHAIRNQSMEANNLAGVIPRLGAPKKIVQNLRVLNGSDRRSISCNTSRINNLSEKNDLNAFFSWVVSTFSLIDGFKPRATYLDNFSTPVSYSAHRTSLHPSSILIKLDKLKDDVERQRISHIYRVDDSGAFDKNLSLSDLIETVEGAFEVVPDGIKWKIQHGIYDDLELKLYEKSMGIRSAKLKAIRLDFDGDEQDLLGYLNHRHDFIVNFFNVEFVYTMRKLWKDHRLLEDLDGFMSVFSGHAELAGMKSEKGLFSMGQKTFDSNSTFGFIVEKLAAKSQVLICDDQATEWADFIGIDKDNLSFYHAKYVSDPGLSASKLHEVIGQAHKNIGFLEPDDAVLSKRMSKWGEVYSNDGVKTAIPRLVIPPPGGHPSLAAFYSTSLGRPNVKKKVHLVITSISRSQLVSALAQLKAGASFGRKAETIQILWFVSSLAANCRELGAELHVHCLP
ncbi:MAG: hypothetical protein KF843_03280 [Flavobacteriales bacterium]|jgi:hypothetical protein|nr:hypothetical protein [Flavobacteriales bacterium]MBZ0206623.1 hypothetical protein [Flavobacteriales bacterium]